MDVQEGTELHAEQAKSQREHEARGEQLHVDLRERTDHMEEALKDPGDMHDRWEQMHAQAFRAEEHAALLEQVEGNQKLLKELAGSLASHVQPHKVHAEHH